MLLFFEYFVYVFYFIIYILILSIFSDNYDNLENNTEDIMYYINKTYKYNKEIIGYSILYAFIGILITIIFLVVNNVVFYP